MSATTNLRYIAPEADYLPRRLSTEQLATSAFSQRGRVEYPAANDLVAAVIRLVAHAALVAIFFSSLDVQRLAQQFAVFHVALIHAFQQGAVVAPQIFRAD